jgi:hypothetical protein
LCNAPALAQRYLAQRLVLSNVPLHLFDKVFRAKVDLALHKLASAVSTSR